MNFFKPKSSSIVIVHKQLIVAAILHFFLSALFSLFTWYWTSFLSLSLSPFSSSQIDSYRVLDYWLTTCIFICTRMGYRELIIRSYDVQNDKARVEDLERRCEVGPAERVVLFTDTMGDPICRIRNSPMYKMLVPPHYNFFITSSPQLIFSFFVATINFIYSQVKYFLWILLGSQVWRWTGWCHSRLHKACSPSS